MPADSVLNAITIAQEIGFIQRITDVTILEHPHTAQVLFHTTQPTKPIVEILQPANADGTGDLTLLDTQTAIWWPTAPLVSNHQFTFGRPEKRLPQGTRLMARITAPPTMFPTINPTSAVRTVWFSTPVRRVTTTIDEIIVRKDGDPNSAGEMSFAMAFYDAETGARLTSSHFVDDDNAYDGKVIPVGRQDIIRFAPDKLALYVKGYDWDEWDIPFPGKNVSLIGIQPPTLLPAAPSSGEDDLAEWADGIDVMNLPMFVTDNFTRTSRLDSKWGGVSFHVTYTVRCEVVSRFSAENPTPGSPQTRVLKTAIAKAGEVAGVRTEAGHVHLMTTTPGGALLYRHVPPVSGRDGNSTWQQIGEAPSESLTLHARRDGAVHVFSTDRDGVVCHRRLSGDGCGADDQQWERLGGSVTGQIHAVTVDGTVELFARSRDGILLHRPLPTRRGPRAGGWEPLGPCPDAIADVLHDGGTVHVFTRDARGRVFHKHRTDVRWAPSQHGWVELGGGFGGPVVAATDERGGVAVAAFSEDGAIRYRTWEDGAWDREDAAWRRVDQPDERTTDDEPVKLLA